MSEDSESESSNDTSTSNDEVGREALAANKTQNTDGDHHTAANSAQKSGSDGSSRTNASTKKASSGSDSTEKSGEKNPSDGNDVPSANEVSIPSSVDPDAPANTEGDNSDGSSNSDSSE